MYGRKASVMSCQLSPTLAFCAGPLESPPSAAPNSPDASRDGLRAHYAGDLLILAHFDPQGRCQRRVMRPKRFEARSPSHFKGQGRPATVASFSCLGLRKLRQDGLQAGPYALTLSLNPNLSPCSH